MKRLVFFLAVCMPMLLTWFAATSQAAEIKEHPLRDGWTAIEITGAINDSDYDKFTSIAERVPDRDRVEVWLDSPGGVVSKSLRHRHPRASARL